MKALKLAYWGILPLVLFSGCGGSSSTTTTGTSDRISYAGSTDPATLTATASSALLGGAFQGGQIGNAFGSAAGLNEGDAAPHRPRILLLSQRLAEAIGRADLTALPAPGVAAVNAVTAQTAGNCGGQMAYTGTADDSSREFSATFTFTDYCQDATTFSGSVTATGQTDATLGFEHLSLSFDALTVRTNNDGFTANGYEIITPGTSAFGVEMNMLLKDTTSKKVYKLDRWAFIVEQGSGFIDLGIDTSSSTAKNRYFDPDYGYVELSTPVYLRILDDDYWPSSGSLKGTGIAGTATNTTGINTSATLTALSNTTFQLDRDTDGDGTTDSTSTGSWADL